MRNSLSRNELREKCPCERGGLLSRRAHSQGISDTVHRDFYIPALKAGGEIRMIPLRGLNPDSWDSIKASVTTRTIAVKGTFRYYNGFEQVPEEPFCFIWYAHPQVLNSAAEAFVRCEEYQSVRSMFAAFDKQAESKK